MESLPTSFDDLAAATGLALALIAAMIERPEAPPRGEIARYLALLADTAAPDRQAQRTILAGWAELLATRQVANDG